MTSNQTIYLSQKQITIYSHTAKQTHTIFDTMNCSTKAVIYVITCNLCKKTVRRRN